MAISDLYHSKLRIGDVYRTDRHSPDLCKDRTYTLRGRWGIHFGERGFRPFFDDQTAGPVKELATLSDSDLASYTFFGGFAAAMYGALWGYDGWDNLTFVAGEVKDPRRNIPLAIIGSMFLIIVLYVIAQIAYFYVLDPTTIASVSSNSSVAKVVVSMFFGGNAASIATGAAVAFFTVGLMLSSLGTLHTSLLSAARIPYRMSRERADVSSLWTFFD